MLVRRLAPLVALILAFGAAPAYARRPLIAVVPFVGPQARKAEAVVVHSLRRRARLVPPARWARSARKLFAHNVSAGDIAAVAEDVGAEVVVLGAVKRDGRHWQLAVSVHDGATGHTRERLKYPLRIPRLSARTLRLLSIEVVHAYERALRVEKKAERSPTVAPPRAVGAQGNANGEANGNGNGNGNANGNVSGNVNGNPNANANGNANGNANANANGNGNASVRRNASGNASVHRNAVPPPLGMEDKGPTPFVYQPTRPRWTPYLEVAAGLSVTGRSFYFNPASQPSFTSGVVAGVHADATVYPFAFSHHKAHGIFAGLGLGGTFDKPFWPNSSAKVDPNLKISTQELRIEGLLRWRLTLYRPLPRPQLLLEGGYGYHSFALSKSPNDGSDVGPPDVAYQYLTVGIGLRLSPAEWVSLFGRFNYHFVFNSGPIDSLSEYGATKNYGLRATGGVDFRVWRGLELGAQGFYERFSLTFAGGGMPVKVANSALDTYFGGMILVGYVL